MRGEDVPASRTAQKQPAKGAAICTDIVAHFNCAKGGVMAKNVTLRLDEAVLRKARHAAVEEDKSLSERVAGLITHVT